MAWVEDWFVARVFTYSRKATRFSSLWATVDNDFFLSLDLKKPRA